jgi:hypothetical protein
LILLSLTPADQGMQRSSAGRDYNAPKPPV